MRCDAVADQLRNRFDQFQTSQAKELIVEGRLFIRLGKFLDAFDKVVVHVKSTSLLNFKHAAHWIVFTLAAVIKADIPLKLSMNSFVYFSKSARSMIKKCWAENSFSKPGEFLTWALLASHKTREAESEVLLHSFLAISQINVSSNWLTQVRCLQSRVNLMFPFLSRYLRLLCF